MRREPEATIPRQTFRSNFVTGHCSQTCRHESNRESQKLTVGACGIAFSAKHQSSSELQFLRLAAFRQLLSLPAPHCSENKWLPAIGSSQSLFGSRSERLYAPCN
jgi:hypothetical protein